MSRTAVGLILLVLAVATSWLALAMLAPPAPLAADAPADQFSAARALEHVRVIAQEPRPLGSPAHTRAREYILERLRALGLDPQVQTATGESSWRRSFGTVHNVLARLPGTGGGGGGAVLLMAHYDSVPAGPGASDDAAGVATVLETLRALGEGPPLANDLIVLVTDGEELGLIGAEAFANEHPWAEDVRVVLNFEARGTRGPALMFETGRGNRPLIPYFGAAPHPIAASYSNEIYRRMPNDTDFSIFRDRGIRGLNFAHVHGAVGYHTAEDSIARLSPATLQHHGGNALALVRSLGDGALDEVAAPVAGDAVYFNPLGSWLVRFPASWVLPLMIVIALLPLLAFTLALRRGHLRAGGLAAGFAVQLVAVAVPAVVALVARGLLFPLPYDFRIWGDGSSVAWTLFGVVLLSAGLAGLVYAAARRGVEARSLAAGGLLLWTVVAILVSVSAPGASYLFLVPLFFQAFATATFLPPATEWAAAEAAGTGNARAPVAVSVWATLAAAIVVAGLVWAPALALTAVGLAFGAGVIVAALTGLLLALIAPQLELITRLGSRWTVPAALTAAGVVLIVAVRLSAGFGPASPQPNSLFYTLDADSGEARWATLSDRPDAWTARVVGEGSERTTLPAFLGSDTDVTVARARALPLPSATLEVLEASARRHRLRVVPPTGADRLRVMLAPGSALAGVAVQGRPIEVPDDLGDGALSFVYSAPPSGGIELVIDTTGAQALDLGAVASWYRLPGADEGGPGPRESGTMATGRFRDTDTTLVRKQFAITGDAPLVGEEPVAVEGDPAAPASPAADGGPGDGMVVVAVESRVP